MLRKFARLLCAFVLLIGSASAANILYTFETGADGFTSASLLGAASGWARVSSGCAGSSLGCFSVGDPSTIDDKVLISPVLVAAAATPTLSFDHSWSLEAGFDGGVVEISVGGGGWADVFSVTNLWIANGYNRTISTGFSSPIGGRQAFSASSAYVNSSILLSTVALGDSFQLRFRRATDSSVSGTGWTVDNIALTEIAESVPEPSCTLPLLVAGFAGWLIRRRGPA